MKNIYWFYLFALLFSGFMGGMGALVGDEIAKHKHVDKVNKKVNHTTYRLWGSVVGIASAVAINIAVYFAVKGLLYEDVGYSDSTTPSTGTVSVGISPSEDRFLPLEDRSRTLSDKEVDMLRKITGSMSRQV